MISVIYLDMDGVLANFDKGIREMCGMEPMGQDSKDDDIMWARAKEAGHFYDKLEPLPGAIEMYNVLTKIPGVRVEILTGIPKSRRGLDTAGEDKTNWAHRYLSPYLKVNIVYTEEKPKFVTGKDCVLIDDLKKNIDNWEAMGGTGILHTSANETLNILKKLI